MQNRRPHIHQGNNRVRIIGGIWRSLIIEFPALSGLRPTPDRVRETLFNWLGQSLTGKSCLDLFSGSGALGFEAASRGASSVTMVENARPAVEALRRNRERLGATQCEIVSGDALDVLSKSKKKYDVIFIDPPFSSDLLPLILTRLSDCLNDGAVIYAEWRMPLAGTIAQLPENPWEVLRASRAGAANFALLSLQKLAPSTNETCP
jgi:16S rRNA (guanine966-N2)-methyltransferase